MSEDEAARARARARGTQVFERVLGAPGAAGEGPYYDVTVEHLFGNVWARGDLSDRDRRLLTIAVLTAMGETGALATHLRWALANGELTPEELHGAVVFLAHYAGWPRGSGAFTALCRVLDEHRSSGI